MSDHREESSRTYEEIKGLTRIVSLIGKLVVEVKHPGNSGLINAAFKISNIVLNDNLIIAADLNISTIADWLCQILF